MMAHPHFHALLLVKPSYFKGQGYIKQADWVEMWAKALRADYLPSVNVKAVKATLDEKGRKQLDKAICETLKYSVKPSDLALERDKGAWLHEMTKQVHKMRFIATGGVLKGILKPEDEITTEEMISSSEEVQDVGEIEWHFSSSLNIENMFMRQNITNMQTNFFLIKYRKVQAQYSKNDNKIIAPNFCNFVKSVLEIVACTSIKF